VCQECPMLCSAIPKLQTYGVTMREQAEMLSPGLAAANRRPVLVAVGLAGPQAENMRVTAHVCCHCFCFLCMCSQH
jgi:hypothetical protein